VVWSDGHTRLAARVEKRREQACPGCQQQTHNTTTRPEVPQQHLHGSVAWISHVLVRYCECTFLVGSGWLFILASHEQYCTESAFLSH
jgi:hypothetical protein